MKNADELKLLRKVLPKPFVLVNKGTSIWDPDEEWQLDLEHYDTAMEVVAKIIAVTKASAHASGRCQVQLEIRKALDLPTSNTIEMLAT